MFRCISAFPLSLFDASLHSHFSSAVRTSTTHGSRWPSMPAKLSTIKPNINITLCLSYPQMFAVYHPATSTMTPQYPTPMNIIDNNEVDDRSNEAAASSSTSPSENNTKKVVRFTAEYDPLKNNKKSFDPILKAVMSLSAAEIREHNLRRRQKREAEIELFLRVKALLCILQKRDPKLRQQVILAVQLCNRKLSDGRISRTALNDNIESTLRLIVGDDSWRMACDVQRRIERHERRSADQDKKVKASSRAA